MMRMGFVLLALFVLAACGGTQQTPRDLDQIGREYQDGTLGQTADTCSMSAHHDFIGRAQSDITLPEGARFICFGCMATQDHAPRRLNLQLGPDGKVASLRCG